MKHLLRRVWLLIPKALLMILLVKELPSLRRSVRRPFVLHIVYLSRSKSLSGLLVSISRLTSVLLLTLTTLEELNLRVLIERRVTVTVRQLLILSPFVLIRNTSAKHVDIRDSRRSRVICKQKAIHGMLMKVRHRLLSQSIKAWPPGPETFIERQQACKLHIPGRVVKVLPSCPTLSHERMHILKLADMTLLVTAERRPFKSKRTRLDINDMTVSNSRLPPIDPIRNCMGKLSRLNLPTLILCLTSLFTLVVPITVPWQLQWRILTPLLGK